MTRITTTAVLLVFSGVAGYAVDSGPLRAGAAKVEITPSMDWGLTNSWGTKFQGVHDPVYVRAIVVDNGANTAAIVSIDTVGNDVAGEMTEGITKATGVPAKNVILVSTHDHNSARVSRGAPNPRNNQPPPVVAPGAGAYTAKAISAVVDAVRQAKAALQPATIGIGTGAVDININRDQWTSTGYKLGNNVNGPSDKTVWVVRLDKPNGEPIALFINYAVHSVVLGPDNTQVTGDLSGAASRWVEQRYGNKLVALWTSGPAGDQNPKYMAWGMSWGPTYTGKTTEPGFPLNDTLGQMLGEEVARVSEGITKKVPTARILAAEKVVTCPGKVQARAAAQQAASPAKPADVDLRLGLILLNDIALAGVQSEIVTNIYYHLKKDSPFSNTIMVTHNFGSMGYIPEDAAYDRPTFEVNATRFARGCAEDQIVKGFVDAMGQYQ